MRILVVEDNEEFYHSYLLRFFAKLLPVDKLQFVHTPRVAAALELLKEPWSIILMDYALSDSVKVEVEGQGTTMIKDGRDLIKIRRRQEQTGEGLPTSLIIGMASSQIGNQILRQAGAQKSFLKLQVPEMAAAVKAHLGQIGA